ncbi:acyltransferase family protein [Larkinella sp. VNQ87]|uniref:acyltransferase family protein n=1 Tax=Larkinella sp. VNQ87 TaxID=3400921 RepID=UPI003C08F80F
MSCILPAVRVPDLIIPAVVVGATVFSGIMTLLGHPYFFNFPLNDFFFSPFNLEFCLGITVYFLTRPTLVRIPLILVAAACALFVYTGQHINPADLWFRVGGLGLPATVLLLALIQWEKTGTIRYPARLLKLGDASYMLYLIHMPVVMVVTHALLLLGLRQHVLVTNFALLIGLVWFSGLAHQRIEKPLLHWLNNRPRAAAAFSYRLTLLNLVRILVSKPSATHKMFVR